MNCLGSSAAAANCTGGYPGKFGPGWKGVGKILPPKIYVGAA